MSKSSRKHSSQKASPSKKTVLWVQFAVILALITIIVFFVTQSPQENANPYIENVQTDPAFEKQVTQVASQFLCGCNQCPDLPLETCSCSFAKQERDYIRSSLKSGKDPDQVIDEVLVKFGNLKQNADLGSVLN